MPSPRTAYPLALAFLAASLPSQEADPRPRPNILLLMADDQGFGDVGFRGHPHLKTPTLDQLARTAVRFERFYAAAPLCSPTRGSCLTGRHPYRYGIRGANHGHIKEQEATLAELLREQGYRTGHFGKWHLGTLTKTERDSNRGGRKEGDAHYAPPQDHGFDVCFSTEAKVPTFDPMKTPPQWAGDVPKDRQPGTSYGTAYWNESGERIIEGLDGDDSRIIMDRALPFIEDAVQVQKPFLAVLWFHAPHLPVVAGEAHRALYSDIEDERRRHYYGCLTALDEQVGRLRTRLRELGVADDTMLFYCSDNGPEGNDQAPGRTGGLRGRKRSLFEGGIRVPAFLEWPGRFKGPKVVTTPCCTSDYLPTIMDALGMEPSALPIDGTSMLPFLAGDTAKRGKAIGFQSGNQAAWLLDRFKLIQHGRKTLLFDIVQDPEETTNLCTEKPTVAGRMRAGLRRWQTRCDSSARGGDYR
ncbi:MAG: sulfatase-like hydrolase/transferase [Planctomycetota bacterium]